MLNNQKYLDFNQYLVRENCKLVSIIWTFSSTTCILKINTYTEYLMFLEITKFNQTKN
jgi:hypothetical protein